jgi:hypothetical protein
LAFDLRSKVVKTVVSNDQRRSSDLDFPPTFATLTVWILERLLLLLKTQTIEENISQPSNTWKNFLTFVNRGPPCFNDYYYLYGLLDCATQLGRILDETTVPLEFEERMREIVKKSKDASLRWKAVCIHVAHTLK